MKRVCCWCTFIFVFMIFMVLITACGQNSIDNNLNEVSMKEHYCEEDFQSIIIGKSTYQDVYNIAPPKSIQVTSYGGFCEYPMKDGKYLRIKFYGKEMIVGMIEVDSSSVKNE